MSAENLKLGFLSIHSAMEHLESTVRQTLARAERQTELKNAEVLNEVRVRKEIAQALKLDKQLYRIYQHLSKQTALNLKVNRTLPASLSTAVRVVDRSTDTIVFCIAETEYRLRYSDTGSDAFNYDNLSFGSAELIFETSDGERVYAAHIAFGKTGGQSRRKSDSASFEDVQVSAFKPGRWVYDVIHAVQTLVVNEKLESINHDFSQAALDELKERFGIER